MRSIQEPAKNVRGGVIERCEHWLAEERPKYLIEQLLRFFGEEEGGPTGDST
jgi:hypothetical protein